MSEIPDTSTLTKKAVELVGFCRDHNIMLATAESCTGGLIAALLTEVPGSSAVLDRGYVTYSNAAKTQMLGVSGAMIEKHGAVSKDVALAMVDGALQNSGIDIAVAVTGIAGPDGGTDEKPVGLVHIAAGLRNGKRTHVRKVFDDQGRHLIRLATVETAFAMVREQVLDDLAGDPV